MNRCGKRHRERFDEVLGRNASDMPTQVVGFVDRVQLLNHVVLEFVVPSEMRCRGTETLEVLLFVSRDASK